MPTSGTDDGKVEAANGSSGPGARLRQAREAQGLQLEEVANELRVGAAALVALEENRFAALGAAVFARGYLKQYGSRLGLDVRELIALYEKAGEQPEVELAPTKGIHLRDERQISLWVVAALALVFIGGGLSYWWWRQAEIDSTPVAADASRDADAPAPGASGAGEAVADPAAPAREPEPELELAAEAVPEAEPATLLPDESPAAVVETAPQAAPSPADPTVERQLAGAVEPAAVEDGPVLEVIFVEDCWTEIIDEDGGRLFYNLGRAGTRARLPADRNLNIYFGNASGVELRIDGEAVPVPGAARRDVVRFDLEDVMN
jgi:cytoskeleton protein RodZ